MTARPFQATAKIEVELEGRKYTYDWAAANDGPIEVEVDVPDESTDLEVTPPVIDYDQVALLLVIPTVPMTIKTNSSTVPDNTLTFSAARPYLWFTGALDALKLTADVTKLYVTNSSGAAGVLKIVGLQDATP